jgi:hypothetical protein
LIIDLLINWPVHLSQTREYSAAYGWGTFADFLREYGNREWNSYGWEESWFCDADNSEVHADIIRFGKKAIRI